VIVFKAPRQVFYFCDEREVAHQFAAAAKISRRRHAKDAEPCGLEMALRGFEQLGRTMQMPPAKRATPDFQTLQNFGR
jgi:hypothetical protein